MEFTLPNIISMLRIVIAPIFLFLAISDNPEYVKLGIFLYFFGAFTDYIDGWIARRFESVSKLGKFVDPLADKFLTTAAFIVFIILDYIPVWMVVVILIRDFGTTFLRVYADNAGKDMKTSFSAKLKTFIQMVYIALLLIYIYMRNSGLISESSHLNNDILIRQVAWWVMLGITIFTVWTLIEYFRQNRSLFKK